ncbi:MAG: MFS transporter [Nocardiopsaceae bacterium]|jgi:MFS family permease|nr:MFS transporter [Nocardiopsaceae bacterium]
MSRAPLSRATWLLIIGDAVSSLGTGLVLPLTLIYLHQVRGIGLAEVGALMATVGAVGLIAVPLTGIALDRFGARPVLLAVLCGQALAKAGLAWAHSGTTALPVMLLLGASLGPSFPAFQTMLAGINKEPARQQRAFALNFTGINAGVGVGGAVGAAVANPAHPASFQLLFLVNAVLCLICAAIVITLPNVRPSHEADRAKAGYREVLSNRPLRTALLAILALGFTGYAALDSGLPAYATVEAHLAVRVVALSITLNTIVIVASQLFVLRLVRRLRRSRALAAIGLIWAVSWAVFGLSALPVSEGFRIAAVLVFAGLFGVGETFMAPTTSPLVNSLASDRVRGRANALGTMAYSIAFVVSPAICTGMIAAGAAAAWIGLLCAGCAGTALLGLRIGKQLGRHQDIVQDADQPQSAEPALT